MTKLPGPGESHTANPEVIDAPGKGAGVLVKTKTTLDVTPKLSGSDTFSTTDNFVTVFGEPGIEGGLLAGEGVARYKNQCLTDNHKMSGVIGALDSGTTRLFICGDEVFRRYFGLEISRSGSTNTFSIIRGDAASSIETGTGLLNLLFGVLSLVFSLFSGFSQEVTKYASTTVPLVVGDEVAIWYDEATHTIRTYKNDVATACLLEVPRGIIPHGPGNRWCGVATEIDVFFFSENVGPQFTSVTIEDV